MTATTSLFEKHKTILENSVKALQERDYYSPYPENMKAYPEEANAEGKNAFQNKLNNDFKTLHQIGEQHFIGEEVSPYLQLGLGIRYPQFSVDQLVTRAKATQKEWANIGVEARAGILIESLDRITKRFFEIAYATMHTTGQSFLMSFQASGPHANDRSLEAIAMGYHEISRFPSHVEWVKNMGKFDIKINKDYKAMPKGIGLVIGCSTFPTWNTVPGVFADLITGNPVIVKPHSKAILPIAIVIEEIQNVLADNDLNPHIIQLAVDTQAKPITKELAEHTDIKLIDYTGGSPFGNYIESLQQTKTVFTEKAGINSVILHSSNDWKAVMNNIAFSVSLYSGQMCTAPQNVYIPKDGLINGTEKLSFEDVVKMLTTSIEELVNNPKMGSGTLGGIQADATYERVQQAAGNGGKVVLASIKIANPEFQNARIASPTVIEVDATDKKVYLRECFGPVVYIIKTENIEDAIELAKNSASEHGAITCLAYATDEQIIDKIEEEMNSVFTPVSFNFTGAMFVNQHAAFSDFHVTGGNPAGNATFTNPEYINKRLVWVGNRKA